jgi:hypothetical protein
MPCVGTVVRIRGVLRMLRGCLPVNELPAMNGPTVAATQEWDAMPVDRKTIWDGPLEGHGTGSDDNSIRLSPTVKRLSTHHPITGAMRQVECLSTVLTTSSPTSAEPFG